MIKKIDHLVITTSNINKCVEFYEGLGFTLKNVSGRYELYAGDFKINVHIKGRELLPHAKNIKTGSGDFCLEVTESLESIIENLKEKNINVELGIIERTGVKGDMQSIYLRDPDGNLVELSKYKS